MTMVIVVGVVSLALLLGAAWALFLPLPERLRGFLLALSGGALIVSLMTELIEPSAEEIPLWGIALAVGGGAAVFTVADAWISKKFGASSGGGLLAAITLDGIPENLALGVALIGASPKAIAALAGSIFLSNLPEAAGGAKDMQGGSHSKGKVFGLWTAAAALLASAAVIGNLALTGVPDSVLAVIKCFAAGAVVSSLATEVFPKAFQEDSDVAGTATALGLILAFALSTLKGG